MAKKKNKENIKYYVYYDSKTGRIFSVTNEVNTAYDSAIEPTDYEVNKLLTGEWSFLNYVVGYKKLADGSVVKAVVPASDNEYSFKHSSFEWITENSNNADLQVEWDYNRKKWIFSLSPQFKNSSNEIFVTQLLFFITLESDFDFLIRTIHINAQELIDNDAVEVPFISNNEHDINKISISSKLVFRSYNLKITHE